MWSSSSGGSPTGSCCGRCSSPSPYHQESHRRRHHPTPIPTERRPPPPPSRQEARPPPLSHHPPPRESRRRRQRAASPHCTQQEPPPVSHRVPKGRNTTKEKNHQRHRPIMSLMKTTPPQPSHSPSPKTRSSRQNHSFPRRPRKLTFFIGWEQMCGWVVCTVHRCARTRLPRCETVTNVAAQPPAQIRRVFLTLHASPNSPQHIAVQPLDGTDGWQGWSSCIYLPFVLLSEIGTTALYWSHRGACAVGHNAPVEVSDLSFFSAGLLVR